MLNLAALPEDSARNAAACEAVARGAPRLTCAEPDAAASQCTPPAAMRDNPVVIDLVTRARDGDKQAWDALVERYAPLLWSICRRYGLGGTDADDVGQSVWLRLLEQLDKIRDPAALPGWLATTTRRECGRLLAAVRGPDSARFAVDAETVPDERAVRTDHELLLAERNAALREAFMRLPPGGQRLITMLIQDPPVPYAKISAELGIPVGSIGPTRRRCLAKLRRDPAVAALIDAEAGLEQQPNGKWR